LTEVTLHGDHFGSDPRVWVDGEPADVISSTDTEIVLNPALAVDSPSQVVLTVQSGSKMSNGIGFDLVPSGTPGDVGYRLPGLPTGVAFADGHLYIASASLGTPSAGLYEVDSDGSTHQVWAAPPMPAAYLQAAGMPSGSSAWNAPVNLAAESGSVYMYTVLGAVYRYDTATGAVSQVLHLWLNTPNDAMGQRSGLALDSDGNLYVLEPQAGALWRLGADGSYASLPYDSAWAAIACDGTTLYLARDSEHVVDVIEDPTGSPTTLSSWGTVPGTATLHSIAAIDGAIVVGDGDGLLYQLADHTVGNDDGGVLTAFGSSDGYGYPAFGIASDGNKAVYLAQPQSGAVRSMNTDDPSFAPVVAVGIRFPFGAAFDGDTLYLASDGLGVLGGSVSASTIADGTVVALAADGSSRVLEQEAVTSGIAVMPNHSLVVSDCREGTLTGLDPATGDTTSLLSGVDCPGGLYVASSGDIYYTATTIPGGETPEPSTIGRLQPDGTNDASFVTGLSPLTLHVTGDGDTLLAANIGSDRPSALPAQVYSADPTTGGEATLISPFPGIIVNLGFSPLGGAYATGALLGDVVCIDPSDGTVTPFGSTTIGWNAVLGSGGPGALALSLGMTFREDGTILVADAFQGGIIAVAP